MILRKILKLGIAIELRSRTLLELMPGIDLNTNGGDRLSGTICPVLVSALVKRKRHVSKDLVRSFAKALAALALRASAEESLKYVGH